LRTRAIVDQLSGRGHDVKVVAVNGRPPASGRPAVGQMWRALALLVQTIPQLVRYPAYSLAKWVSWGVLLDLADRSNERRDLPTIIDSSQLAVYLPLCRRVIGLSLHNVEHELLANYATSGSSRLRRVVAAHDARVMRRFEKHLMELCLPVFVVSDHDRDLLIAICPGARVVVATNGVAGECFRSASSRTCSVVFIAHLGWQPNIDASVWLVRSVWPHVAASVPEATLLLVGRSPARAVWALESRSVSIIPDVESVIPYVSAARVATAPLLSAGGTRLKILEAVACGTPVVATPLGALGLESAFDSRVLRVQSDPILFANEIIELLRADCSSEASFSCREQARPFEWANSLAPMMQDLELTLDDSP